MTTPRKVVLAAFRKLGEGKAEGIAPLLADDVIWEIMGGDGLFPGGQRYEGRETVETSLLSLVPALYKPETLRLESEHVYADGETVIIEFRVYGETVSGRINDGAAYVWVFKVREGKIVHAREYVDSLRLGRLFGLVG